MEGTSSSNIYFKRQIHPKGLDIVVGPHADAVSIFKITWKTVCSRRGLIIMASGWRSEGRGFESRQG